MRQRLRKLGPLEQSTRGGQKNANIAAGKALERLDALAGNFRVRLGFAESFPRRIARDRQLIVERFEIHQPSLGARHTLGNHDKKPPGTMTAQGGGDDAVAGTFKP